MMTMQVRYAPKASERVSVSNLEIPGSPRRFSLCRLSLRHGEAGADRQRGELIDRVAAGAPVRELLFVEALGHPRMPFAGVRADHRAGVELPAIDAHGAAEAAADLEGGFDHGVAGEARRDRLEVPDFAGRDAAGHSVPPRFGQGRVRVMPIYIGCPTPGSGAGLPL